jgi:hypothetical protein
MKKGSLGSRQFLPIIFACCMGNLVTSCVKDEELNSECDIESAYVHTAKATDLFFSENDTIVNVLSTANNIVFYVRRTADLTSLSPLFRLTEGATISPESGSAHDFSHGPVVYTVTSQDGQWTRQYNVQFKVNPNLMDFDFENYVLEKSRYVSEKEDYGFYYKWNEIDSEGKVMDYWDSGNAGFTLSNSKAKAEEYPTVMIPDGYEGAGVKLITRSTGMLGKTFGKPIAAGNLFIGEFDVMQSMTNTLKTTKFGRPFDRKPMKLTGYYKYKPGDVFTDKNFKTIENRTDSGSIYSVFYRNEMKVNDRMEKMVLYGDDVQTNPNIVALAKFDDLKPTDEWTYFEIEYKYRQGVEEDILNKLGYNLTVVFSSSRSGDTFEGAVGSTLYIDKVRIICDTTEE